MDLEAIKVECVEGDKPGSTWLLFVFCISMNAFQITMHLKLILINNINRLIKKSDYVLC